MKPNNYKSILYYVILFFTVLLIFHFKFGLWIVSPSADSWLYGLNTDMLPDIVTWEHYKNSDFSGRLGVIHTYAWPQEVGIGNTNIIPWMAIPLHWFKGVLPEHFQHFGFFLLLCYLLQAYFADKLLRLLGVKNWLLRMIGTLVLVCSPSLLDRHPHIALCAHFFILASFCVYFSNDGWIRQLVYILLLTFFASLTHPYLLLFPLAIGFAVFLKLLLNKKIRWYTLVIANLLNVLTIVFAFWLSGMFVLPSTGGVATGFGNYSASFDTFFNSQGRALFDFLKLKTYFVGQYEGFAYLGLGVLLLWVILLFDKGFYKFLIETFRKNNPLAIIILLLTIYAWGVQITFLDFFRIGFTFHEHTFIYKLFSIFRSSGRYIWALHLLLFLIPVVYISRTKGLNHKVYLIVFVVLFFLQILDLSKMLTTPRYQNNYKQFNDLEKVVSVLSHVEGGVVAYPVYVREIEELDDAHYISAALGKFQVGITSGHLPRPNFLVQDSIYQLMERVINDSQWKIAGNSVILTGKQHIFNFKPMLDNDFSIIAKDLGNYFVIYKKGNREIEKATEMFHVADIQVVSIMSYLQSFDSSDYILISTKDEASNGLNEDFRNTFKEHEISKLQWAETYIGIWKNNKVLYENRSTKDIELDTILINDSHKVKLELASNFGNENNNTWIKINGDKKSKNKRGINIVVLNKNFEVKSIKNFDLFRTIYNNRFD